jgi:predicted metal-dependent hydrolase
MQPIDRSAIVVRRPSLDLSGEIPRYWNGGDPFATHFLNALSSVFPDGEAFFVRSVQRYRDRIDDPQLRETIRSFAAQEGQHSAQHDRHVRMLLDQGYPGIGRRNALIRRLTRWSVEWMPRHSLAGTAALEHLTALLARKLLESPERWTGQMDPRMARLWQWHALEEAEHKAVAFDVLAQVAPSYPLRVFALVSNTLGLFLEILDRTVYMLWKDGILFRRDVWASGLRFLFGREGLLRGASADYRAWYRRDFHPDDANDAALIAAWRPRVEARVA